jgi:3-carboxy-cis,cis-muconate cycloisomerase
MAQELGLADPPLPWHTERLRIIDVATAAARATATLSTIARDVTLLAQTEVGEVTEGAGAGDGSGGSPRRGGSSAMPNKSNPVAAVAVLGCAKQAPGLLATLVASAEQEHQRAAGAWHAEWQPYSHLLQLTVSASAWARDLLTNLRVDKARMAANLAEAGGMPLAERVTALLRGSLGVPAAHDLVAGAAARSAASGIPLRDVLLATPEIEDKLARAGISQDQIERALDPASYLGSAQAFITEALKAHAAATRATDEGSHDG